MQVVRFNKVVVEDNCSTKSCSVEPSFQQTNLSVGVDTWSQLYRPNFLINILAPSMGME